MIMTLLNFNDVAKFWTILPLFLVLHSVSSSRLRAVVYILSHEQPSINYHSSKDAITSVNPAINQSTKMDSSINPQLNTATVDPNQAHLKQAVAQEAAHIDHSVLNHQPAPTGDIPQLNVNSTSDIKAKNSSSSTTASSPTATGVRQRVNNIGSQLENATEHPAVKNAKDVAGKQVNQFREFLGNFPAVKELEKRFNVDRVVLVVGGLFA